MIKMYLSDLTKDELYAHKKGQKIMTDMLKELDSICRKNNLEYWVTCGTLIGTLRHKGWIPWDGDIDIGMLEKDYKKLQSIIQKNLSKDYWFQDKTTDKNFPSNLGKIRYLHAYYSDEKDRTCHNGIQIDIFVFKENDNMLVPTFKGGEIKNDILKDMIFPLKELTFENIKVYVPNKYKKYSKDGWGDYPPPFPPKEQQYSHEGRTSFIIPKWIKTMYPTLYGKKNIKGGDYLNLKKYIKNNYCILIFILIFMIFYKFYII